MWFKKTVCLSEDKGQGQAICFFFKPHRDYSVRLFFHTINLTIPKPSNMWLTPWLVSRMGNVYRAKCITPGVNKSPTYKHVVDLIPPKKLTNN